MERKLPVVDVPVGIFLHMEGREPKCATLLHKQRNNLRLPLSRRHDFNRYTQPSTTISLPLTLTIQALYHKISSTYQAFLAANLLPVAVKIRNSSIS